MTAPRRACRVTERFSSQARLHSSSRQSVHALLLAWCERSWLTREDRALLRRDASTREVGGSEGWPPGIKVGVAYNTVRARATTMRSCGIVNFRSDLTWFLLELISRMLSSCRRVRLQRLVSSSLAWCSFAASASKLTPHAAWPQAAREDASEMLANFDEVECSLRGFDCSHKMLLHPFPKAR